MPKLCDFQMRRITSVDPKGGNDDYRNLPPGQTLVIAEINGPGCIVHLRDNITSSEPHHLQKHIVRMYWDGEATPSVEAPVGDFFGYYSVAYWYQTEPHAAFPSLPSVAQRIGWATMKQKTK